MSRETSRSSDAGWIGRNSESWKDLGNGVGAGTHAVGNADAGESVSCKGKSGEKLPQALDAINALEVSDAILRHGTTPFVHASE